MNAPNDNDILPGAQDANIIIVNGTGECGEEKQRKEDKK